MILLVNPIKPVADAFLLFFQTVPQPIQALVFLASALFVTSAIINIIFR